MADSFLNRWSQRKQQARAGQPLQEPAQPPEPAGGAAAAASPVSAAAPGATTTPDASAAPADEAPPPLTMEDVSRLTAQSDFKPFVAPGVSAEVRNAAMRKLFTDPHYNVMDRMDTYIDDYSLPDPIPQTMLRQLASARFLNLFEEAKEAPVPQAAGRLGDDADGKLAQSVPELGLAEPGLQPPAGQNTSDHDHTDLRLQPDDAAGTQGPGHGAA